MKARLFIADDTLLEMKILLELIVSQLSRNKTRTSQLYYISCKETSSKLDEKACTVAKS